MVWVPSRGGAARCNQVHGRAMGKSPSPSDNAEFRHHRDVGWSVHVLTAAMLRNTPGGCVPHSHVAIVWCSTQCCDVDAYIPGTLSERCPESLCSDKYCKTWQCSGHYTRCTQCHAGVGMYMLVGVIVMHSCATYFPSVD